MTMKINKITEKKKNITKKETMLNTTSKTKVNLKENESSKDVQALEEAGRSPKEEQEAKELGELTPKIFQKIMKTLMMNITLMNFISIML